MQLPLHNLFSEKKKKGQDVLSLSTLPTRRHPYAARSSPYIAPSNQSLETSFTSSWSNTTTKSVSQRRDSLVCRNTLNIVPKDAVWVSGRGSVPSLTGASVKSIDCFAFSTAGAQPLNGRQYFPSNNPNPTPPYPAQDNKDTDAFRSHTRDPSRGRGPAPANGVSNIQTQQSGIALSPRSQSSAGSGRTHAGLDVGLERQPSVSQGHHRQASRAQGTYLQARNAAFSSSPATSPLSPETPSPATSNPGVSDISNHTMIHRGMSVRRPPESTSHSSSSSTLIGDQDTGDMGSGASTQRRLDRTHSVKGRRGHNPQRSQSRHGQEQKSVGEYALHHLFNKVSNQLILIA